jgi:hypothetical protein
MMLTLPLPSPRRTFAALLSIILLLVALSTIGQVAKHAYGHTQLKGLVPLFYVDLEASVPTWYSSIALLVAAALLAVHAIGRWQTNERFAWRWAALAVVFCGLSADEVAMLHEYPIEPLRQALGLSGYLYYGWVLLGALFAIGVAVFFWQPLRTLPLKTQAMLIAAAVIFLGGAVGVEMLSGEWADQHGEENLTYALIVTAEEFCEMLGVAVFITALVADLHQRFGSVELFARNENRPKEREFFRPANL